MDSLAAWLPPSDGILPYFLLATSAVAVGNSIQTFATLHYTRRIYPNRFVPNPHLPARTATHDPADSVRKLVPAPAPGRGPAGSAASAGADQMTPLAARFFGTWTILAAVVRLYAAYNIRVGPVYDMATWSYGVALGHYLTELLVYRTMDVGPPQLFPLIVAPTALVSMLWSRGYYVE